MADFGNYRESKNFDDVSNAPWYSPQKLLANVMIAMQRVYDPSGKQAELDKVQRERDANPLPPLNFQENRATTVKKVKGYNPAYESNSGYEIHRPGQQFGEYVPSYADDNLPSQHTLDPQTVEVLKRAGLMK